VTPRSLIPRLTDIIEAIERVAPPATADREAALNTFFDRISRMHVLDSGPVDEIVGYDAHGLPS
jgi:hypothetical protein